MGAIPPEGSGKARSSKRVGSAVELRPAPKARLAAHPQERQHSAAEGVTRGRVRPDGTLHCGGHAACFRDRRRDGRRRKLLVIDHRYRLSPDRLRAQNAWSPTGWGEAEALTAIRCRAKTFAAMRRCSLVQLPQFGCKARQSELHDELVHGGDADHQ
jgi:hypothetical protein